MSGCISYLVVLGVTFVNNDILIVCVCVCVGDVNSCKLLVLSDKVRQISVQKYTVLPIFRSNRIYFNVVKFVKVPLVREKICWWKRSLSFVIPTWTQCQPSEKFDSGTIVWLRCIILLTQRIKFPFLVNILVLVIIL